MIRNSLTLSTLLIFAAASLVAAPIEAAETPRKRAKAMAAVKPNAAPRRVYDGRDSWYPNDANQLRFGSQIWWDQMHREGRIGRPPGG